MDGAATVFKFPGCGGFVIDYEAECGFASIIVGFDGVGEGIHCVCHVVDVIFDGVVFWVFEPEVCVFMGFDTSFVVGTHWCIFLGGVCFRMYSRYALSFDKAFCF